MKKLMFVAAVVAAMTGLADVESANVVGYSQRAVGKATNLVVVSQFIAVGTDGTQMTFNDLTPSANWGMTDMVKTFKPSSGAVDKKAVYVTESKLTAARAINPAAQVGWYIYHPTTPAEERAKMYTEPCGDEPLPYGTGVMAYSATKDTYLTTAGEVVSSEDGYITINLKKNENVMLGNCTPISRKLGDFKCGGDWGINDTVKLFKASSGAVETKAVYVSEAKLATARLINSNANVGWYVYYNAATDRAKMYTESLADLEIPAGTGMMVYTTATGATFMIPSAL